MSSQEAPASNLIFIRGYSIIDVWEELVIESS